MQLFATQWMYDCNDDQYYKPNAMAADTVHSGGIAAAISASDQVKMYAKLSIPRLYDALSRPRLFKLLESTLRNCRNVWMAAPPGAGKTTLAASYLMDANVPAVWYQVDASDNDPATLFFYLSQSHPRSASDLPRLSVELAQNVSHFARFFFREYYSRLPGGSVLVLDNVHEIENAKAQHILEIAFAEVPDNISILALSRNAPPDQLSRLEVNSQMRIINWDAIRFDERETKALARLDESASESASDLFMRLDGWAAGIVMLREHLSQKSGDIDIPPLEGQEDIFRYFAGEIFNRMQPESKRNLIKLSFLDSVSEIEAEYLTEGNSAHQLLKKLYRNRLFVGHRGGTSRTYHFHALFRSFLQYEAEQHLDQCERKVLLERTATILEKRGDLNQAAQLYRDAKSYQLLVDLLMRSAKSMLITGRDQPWHEWLSWLPENVVETQPWLWYWRGVLSNPVNPSLAKSELLRAERAFRDAGDIAAQLIVIAGIIDNYFPYYGSANLRDVKQWADAMVDRLKSLKLSTLDPNIDLQIHLRLIMALISVSLKSPELPTAIKHVTKMIALADDPLERLAAGGMLLLCTNWFEIGVVPWLITELDHIAKLQTINPAVRLWWYSQLAQWHAYLGGDLLEAKRCNEMALKLVNDFELKPMLFQPIFTQVLILISLGDLQAAEAFLNKIDIELSPASKTNSHRFAMLRALHFLQNGEAGAAQSVMQQNLGSSHSSDIQPVQRSRSERILACCYALSGDFTAADAWFGIATDHTYGYDAEMVDECRRFVAAYGLWVNGNRRTAVFQLEKVFDRHKQRKLHAFFIRTPKMASLLAEFALSEGVHVEHVRYLIKRQCLAAPTRFTLNWPWKIAIRTLGKFELSFYGEPVVFSGKTQQRQLRLLKTLMALGDTGKSQQSLATSIWGDADNPKANLNVAVHRLRKILNSDDAIIVLDGKIWINQDIVWSDARAVLDLCEYVDNLPDDFPSVKINWLATCLLSLYRGAFCENDENDFALSTTRDRLHNRFLAVAGKLGIRLEDVKQWEAANALYLRVIEVEPLAETMYRGMMRCAYAERDMSACFVVYRRCRHNLSLILGRKPSDETEALAASLGLCTSARTPNR